MVEKKICEWMDGEMRDGVCFLNKSTILLDTKKVGGSPKPKLRKVMSIGIDNLWFLESHRRPFSGDWMYHSHLRVPMDEVIKGIKMGAKANDFEEIYEEL